MRNRHRDREKGMEWKGAAKNTVMSSGTEGQRAEERRKDRGMDQHRQGKGVGQREKDERKKE